MNAKRVKSIGQAEIEPIGCRRDMLPDRRADRTCAFAVEC